MDRKQTARAVTGSILSFALGLAGEKLSETYGWPFICLTILAAPVPLLWGWWPEIKQYRRMWPQALMGFGALLFLGGLGVYFWQSRFPASRSQQILAPVVDAKVMIQCEVGMAPNVPTSGRINGLPLDSRNIVNEIAMAALPGPHIAALTEYFTKAAPGTSFQLTEDPMAQIYRCQITNYDTQPLFDVRIPLRLTFHKVKVTPNGGRTSGDVIASAEYPIQIAKVDTGPDHPFEFFTWMMSPDEFAFMQIPSQVTAQKLGSESRTTLGVLNASTKGFWVNPPRPPAPAPEAKLKNP